METKRLSRSRTDRVLGGVAAGLATYIGVESVFVRLAFVLFSLANGIGLLVYLALWLLLPNEDSTAVDTREQVRENLDEMRQALQVLFDRVRQTFQQQ
jgi:phage shock protein C